MQSLTGADKRQPNNISLPSSARAGSKAAWQRMLSKLFVAALAITLVSAGALLEAQGGGGYLDGNFGMVTMDLTGSDDNANGVVSQPDGKVIVAGYAGSSTFVMRFNTTGQLDTTFGTGGIVLPTPLVYAGCVALQPDGKILVAGSANHGFSVERFNSDGTLDNSFGNGGLAPALTFNGHSGIAYGIVLQPDGKIVLAGHVAIAYRDADFGVARYNSDGSPDLSFGTGGAVSTSFSSGKDEAKAVALQADGKIIVSGSSVIGSDDVDFALARYNPDGTLDSSFDGDGKVTTNFFWENYDTAYGVAVQPDGKIVAAGAAGVIGDFRMGLARYNTNGSLDASFGQGGEVTVKFSSDGRTDGYSVALQPDGKILVGGAVYSGGYNFTLARFNANGNLDQSFGTGGHVTTDFGGDDVAYAMSLQPSGRIILAGHTGAYPNEALALAAYTNDIVVRRNAPADFDGDGRTDISIWRPSDGGWYIINSSNNSSRGPVQWGSATLGDMPVSRDYDGDGKVDVAVFRPSEGNWYVIQSATNTVQVRGWGGSADIPVPADYDGDGKADMAVFRPNEGNWYILNSRSNTMTMRLWGGSTDQPVPGDYDGDGRTDIAVFRPSEGNWYIIQSSTDTLRINNWGTTGDIPVPGDYDGDGKVDVAVFRPPEGNWYIINSSGGGMTLRNWGNNSDQIVPGDYDGDGKADVAVFRPSEGNWYVIQSATNTVLVRSLGFPNDMPVPSTYIQH